MTTDLNLRVGFRYVSLEPFLRAGMIVPLTAVSPTVYHCSRLLHHVHHFPTTGYHLDP
jgi:hypothetical protein